MDMKRSMREKTCCFTGHRKIPTEQKAAVTVRLETVVDGLYRRGIRFFGAGGALGFDTLAAETVLRLRPVLPGVKLILVLPCLSQAQRWSEEDRRIYEEIIERADKTVYISQEYTKDCMFRRNRHLVDNSGICVCYLTERNGGTAYTVHYARSQGLPIINLAREQEMQSMMRTIGYKGE